MSKRFKLGFSRAVYEHRPHGPGWRLVLQPFGRGGGYMAAVYPWHSRNIAAPRWRRARWLSYWPGLTITLGTQQIELMSHKPVRGLAFEATMKAPGRFVPRWWSGA